MCIRDRAEYDFEFISLDGSKITKLGRWHIMNANSYEKYYSVWSKNGGIRLFDDKWKLIYSKKLTLQKDWKLSNFAKITVEINGLIGVNITPWNKDKQVWAFINPKTWKVEKTFDYRVTTKISDNSYIIQSNKYQWVIDKNFKTIVPLKYAVEVLKYTKNYIILADSKTYNKWVLD